LRAIAEGYAGIFLWFEALVLQLLTACRLSTASGIDVDTFTADFMPVVPGTSSPRLAAQAASGVVTVSRFTAAPSSVFIAVNALFTTGDGTANNFVVTADPTYPTFVPVLNGYVMAPGIGSITVPVEAVTPGTIGNVSGGAISQIVSNIVGADTVVNPTLFFNGADFESDGSLKKRFSDYIMGLSRGDIFGLQSSIEGTGITVQWTLNEDYNLDGSWRPGFFFVVADDGSGSPSASFVQQVTDAANAVRPLGIQCAVFAPTIIWATVAMQIEIAAGFDVNTVVGLVGTQITSQINGLGLGHNLPWSILAAWAYAVRGVAAVLAVTLNGMGGDTASLLSTIPTQDGLATLNVATIKCQSVTVSPSPIQPNVLLG
jgi:hypothetical protein